MTMGGDLGGAVDLIFFDYDGVVVESVEVKTHAFARLFAGYGDEVVRAVVEYHRANLGMSRYAKFEYFYANILGQPLAADEVDRLDDRFSSLVEEGTATVPMVRGCKEFLEAHCPPIKAAVVSATPDRDIGRDVARRGLERHFVGAFGSPTSKAEHIARVLAEQRVSPLRAVMVGDARADLMAAQENGIAFVGRRAPDDADVFGDAVHVVVSDLVPLADAIVTAVSARQS